MNYSYKTNTHSIRDVEKLGRNPDWRIVMTKFCMHVCKRKKQICRKTFTFIFKTPIVFCNIFFSDFTYVNTCRVNVAKSDIPIKRNLKSKFFFLDFQKNLRNEMKMARKVFQKSVVRSRLFTADHRHSCMRLEVLWGVGSKSWLNVCNWKNIESDRQIPFFWKML